MPVDQIFVLLADDDKDDCLLFKDALEQLPLVTNLATVHDGEQLMKHLLDENNLLPHVLFLDLNMPRKNGFECLNEIRSNQKLQQLYVIIFSTSSEENVMDLLYKSGAQNYICKPVDFAYVKKVIYEALSIIRKHNPKPPTKENFVLTGKGLKIN